ncbi:MAG: HNH endonuclease [Fidelibacterota bacterium]|nr:MAG: HNH endonuclease [Candidatus Neomarinimicrobiota bacterium]
MNTDLEIRLAAFEWFSEQVGVHGDVLPRELLRKGFEFQGNRIPLVAPQGIFKPKLLDLPLSITSTTKGPYDDQFGNDGFLHYRYRGTDISHRDNVGLREALRTNTPLIYLHSILPGKYLAVWPVFIIGDDPVSLTFKVALDDLSVLDQREADKVSEDTVARRAYLTTTVRTRLHQRSFRERVLAAYQSQCALCRLRHLELLDAAHIIADREPDSRSTVDNGIALCKLHHAAFDSFILGITPDYIIEVREDVLHEYDGPMLLHGLQGMHHSRLTLPKNEEWWPDRELLGARYERFRNC